MRRFARQTVVFLGISVSTALLIAILGFALRYPKGTLPHTYMVLVGNFANDSWKPMQTALDYWSLAPDNGSIYHDLVIEKAVRIQYPPVALLIPKLIRDLDLDPKSFYSRMAYLSLAITIFAVSGIANWSLRTYGKSRLSRRDMCLLLIIVTLFTLTYYPIVKALSIGQIQAWLNAIFAVALFCFLKRHHSWAGILLGLMASIKPQYSLFLLWGVARGNRPFTIAFLTTVSLGVVAGSSVFGVSNYLDYAAGLQFLAHRGESFYQNQSFNGLVNRLFSIHQPELYNNTYWSENSFPPYNPWVYYSTLVTSAAILGVSLFGRRSKASFSQDADFCLMALGATMASPQGWEFHYGILLPIFALLVPLLWFEGTFSADRCLRLIVVACFLLSTNSIPVANILAPTFVNFLQSYLLFAGLGVFIVLLTVRQRQPESSALPQM
jgi:alpha-1,2-mannosyltransferase